MENLWTQPPQITTYIREVILENFMSYEYARIPLKPGLNVICGPNGSGKSSILLGISVALGQAYTERSRRLADLIRRGKDIARVSLVFDNTPKNGVRPIPFSRSDSFLLSRYIRVDGSYWFEADFREIGKAEVVAALQRLGLNPDNMILLMHQGMVEEFTVVPPPEKLRMVEEAVGFHRHRESILEARSRLQQVVAEEEALAKLLQEASQTLDHWRRVYQRYLEKKKLLDSRSILEGELLWAKVVRAEQGYAAIRERLSAREHSLERVRKRLEKARSLLEKGERDLGGKQVEERRYFATLARLERERGRSEASLEAVAKVIGSLQEAAQALEAMIPLLPPGERVGAEARLKVEALRASRQGYASMEEEARRRLADIGGEVERIHAGLGEVQRAVEAAIEKYAGSRAEVAVLEFEERTLERLVENLRKDLARRTGELEVLKKEAEAKLPRPPELRPLEATLDELRMAEAKLAAYADVSEEAEALYHRYEATFQEVRGKLALVAENKAQALKEVERRRDVWRKAIDSLLEAVNPAYQAILVEVGGVGEVRLVEADDVEKAGLEILVGFRGSEPRILDSYTQSGGERGTAVVAFLLALQQRIVSPLRAIDEFDTHLDPHNREGLFRSIYSQAKFQSTQWLVITPGQVAVTDPSVSLIVVQAVRGVSAPRMVAS